MTTDQAISTARISVITLTLFVPLAVDQGPLFTCVLAAGAAIGALFARSLVLATKQARRSRRLRTRTQ